MLGKKLFVASLLIVVLGVFFLSVMASIPDTVERVTVSDLLRRQGELEGEAVEVTGKVKNYVSFLMHEDFWLEDENGSKIPVEVRQNGLPLPNENARITVKGELVRHEFEGGFYSIHADSWEELAPQVAHAIPI